MYLLSRQHSQHTIVRQNFRKNTHPRQSGIFKNVSDIFIALRRDGREWKGEDGKGRKDWMDRKGRKRTSKLKANLFKVPQVLRNGGVSSPSRSPLGAPSARLAAVCRPGSWGFHILRLTVNNGWLRACYKN